jgi:Protein of unknown function (DUF402)
MKFAPGEALVRRHWRGGRITRMHVLRVAADDVEGLRLWMPSGSAFWRVDESGQLARAVWHGADVMLWLPANKPYSVCWYWADGMFDGWSANLEEPYVRWADRGCAGVDTADQSLGLVVRPDRSWRWRDEDEFHARTGHPLYWTDAQAAQIRSNGDRLVKLVEAAEFPFDGAWCGFRPDAAWTVPGLPPGHDRPRALATRP